MLEKFILIFQPGFCVALFILGEPPTLQVVNLKTKEATILAEDIGRSLFRYPGEDNERICFSQKGVIKIVAVKSQKTEAEIPMLQGNDYFCLMPDGALVMAVKAELYRFRPGKDDHWTKIGDFSAFGINNISRIAISPKGDKLAFVSQ